MNIAALIAKVERHIDAYFMEVENAVRENRLRSSDGTSAVPAYPNVLLVCETPTHFVVELLGAAVSREPKLRLVQRSMPSLDNVLGRFPADRTVSLIKFEGKVTGGGVQTMALMSSRNHDLFQSRYPEFPDLHPTTLIYFGELGDDEAFYPFAFPADLQDIALVDVMIMAEWHQRVRARYFQSALIVARTMSTSELQRKLESRFPVGEDTTLLAPSTNANQALLTTAANFATLASIDKIGETTITRFLEANEEILASALGGVRIIAQPLLEWIEGNPDTEELAVQPDFLLIDSDGQAHLCEVKLPLLERETLTAGKHKRRRFVSPVIDGLAQLANYQEYFSIKSHQDLVSDRYGVSISDPRSILIVGNFENFDAEDTRQAKRMHGSIEVIDYDTLRTLYLVSSGYLPGQ